MESQSFKRALEHRRHFLTSTALGHSGKWKIIRYDFEKLVKVGGFATLVTKGSVFHLDAYIFVPHLIYAALFVSALITVQTFTRLDEFSQNTLPHIDALVDDVKSFCPFLFGLFVSVTLTRWWAIRTMAVGSLQTHIINISSLLVSYGGRVFKRDEDYALFKKNHDRLVNYGLASLSCVAQESRGNHMHIEELVRLGFLTEKEKEIIDPCSNKATILWCWMTSVGAEILEMMKIPAPNHNNFFTEVRLGLEGISKLHEYLGTQLPFPYVHMITLMVNVNNMLMAIIAGCRCGVAMDRGATTICVVEVMQLILVPILYQGLLQVCVMLGDPLGEDIIDFPILEFQLNISEVCACMLESSRKIHAMRRQDGLGPLPHSIQVTELEPPGQMRKPAAMTATPQPVAAPPQPATLGSASSSAVLPPLHNEILEHIEKGFEELKSVKQQAGATSGPMSSSSLHPLAHAEFLERIDRKFEELKQSIIVNRAAVPSRALPPLPPDLLYQRDTSESSAVRLAEAMVGQRDRTAALGAAPQMPVRQVEQSMNNNLLDCCAVRSSARGERVSPVTPVLSIHHSERVSHVLVEEKLGAPDVR